MAGHAAKKREKHAQTTLPIYLFAAGISLALHVGWRVCWKWSTFTRWDAIGVAVLASVTYVTCSGISSGLSMGSSYTMYQDVFFVNVTVLILTMYTRLAWYLFLLVPGYGIYKIGRLVADYVFAPPVDEEDSAKSDKKRQKMERKMRQGNVKYVR